MSSVTLCFNQLLDAVKLELLQQQLAQTKKQQQSQLLCKLGEDYQERLIIPKMRSVHTDHSNGSAGSSRRSTPTDSIFSNCSSTQSSSPNSPPTLLQVSTSSQPNSGFINVPNSVNLISPHQFISQELLSTVHPMLNTLNLASNILEQQQNKSLMNQPELSLINNTPTCSSVSTSTTVTPATIHHHRCSPSSSAVSLSLRQSRAAHNELEKNRRANLRGYLDKLKTVLPVDSDSTRDTTLSLLTRARNYLRNAKQEKDTLLSQRKNALAELLQLRQELVTVKIVSTTAAANETEIKEELMESKPSLPQLEHEINQLSFDSANQSGPVESSLLWTISSPSSAFTCINGSTALAFVEKKTELANPIKPLDLHLEGLLPAFPLLYPYQDLIHRHTALSSS